MAEHCESQTLFRLVRGSGKSLFLLIGWLSGAAQAPQVRLKPTELVIKQYERLVLHGALLTPEGWKLASSFFTAPQPYPENGEIQVEWTGTNVLGEEWNDGSRAQVNTKWNDHYGAIDSNLRFKSDAVLPLAEYFTLVLVPREGNTHGKGKADRTSGGWKIEGPLRGRVAYIPDAIKYLERMRDQSKDPRIRKNAENSITALRSLKSGCGTGSAC